MPDTNYSVVVTAGESVNHQGNSYYDATPTTTTFRIATYDTVLGSWDDDSKISFVVIR